MTDNGPFNLQITRHEANVIMRAIATHNEQLARAGKPTDRIAPDTQAGTWIVDRIIKLIDPARVV